MVAAAAVGIGSWTFSESWIKPTKIEYRVAQESRSVIERPPRAAAPAPQQPDASEVKAAAVLPTAIAPPIAATPPRWVENAVISTAPSGQPMIAIVIDDMGVDRRRSARALDLPGPLTMAFLPYAEQVQAQAARARQRGHELLVHVPMEPADRSVNPGPNALLTSLSSDEALRRLKLDLAAFDGYVGINNHMGSRFTSDPNALTPILKELKARGLLFLDSRTGRSAGVEIARRLDLPHAARDVFIDHDVSAAAVAESLRKIEAIARRSGHAVGIGHPKDETLDQLAQWLPGLSGKGFAVVPISAIVRATYAAGVD